MTSKTATDVVLLVQLSDLQSKKPKRGKKADILPVLVYILSLIGKMRKALLLPNRTN